MTLRRTPSSIWHDLRISTPEEADIEVMAYFCGATVKYRHLTSCAARIVGKGNKAIITVDQSSRPERQRFSVAHELGHWLHDRGEMVFNCHTADISPNRYKNYETDPEAAANRFAAELLMPSLLFREVATSLPITFETANQLARLFQVSETAAAVRLVELGSFPSIIVCHGIKGYKWSWRHPELPFSVRVRRLLSKHTEAYRLLRDPSYAPPGPSEVDADDWVDHATGGEYVVTEDSIRLDSRTTLSLIWWHDESALIAADDY